MLGLTETPPLLLLLLLLLFCVCVLQDIAIVPFLVLLPLIESSGGMEGASADTLLQVGDGPGLAYIHTSG